MSDKNEPVVPQPITPASAKVLSNAGGWITGDEPVTNAQVAYLKTLCKNNGVTFEEPANKGQASVWIQAMRTYSGLPARFEVPTESKTVSQIAEQIAKGDQAHATVQKVIQQLENKT